MLWIEKYKPKDLSDITSHSEVVSNLKCYALETVPNLIFHGDFGHNKRTILYCLIRNLYGKYPSPIQKTTEMNINGTQVQVSYLESDEMIEINPSEYGYRDRYVIQNIIKEMAQTKPILGLFGSQKKSIKTIVISSAENLTKDAQAALRRTMEVYSNHFRIFMVCNQISKLIEPIKSRCLFVRFRGFNDSELKDIIERVLEGENETLDTSTIDGIVKASNGDCKKALCILELFCLNRNTAENKKLKVDSENFKLPWEADIAKTAELILTKQTTDVFSTIRKNFYSLLNSCIDPEIILLYLVRNLCKGNFETVKTIARQGLIYEDRIRAGTKPLLHLEGFSAAALCHFYKNSTNK